LRSFEIVRLYFALVAGALIIAAISGAALSWDGSYYLFQTLDKQTPFVPDGRSYYLLLNWPALAITHFTADFSVVRSVFGLSYILVPLLSLGASWLIVRKAAPSLFIWPALAIGLGTLAGQFFLTGQGIQPAQLAWPILLATLLRLPGRPFLIALVFAALVFALHPIGIAIFALCALVATVLGLRYEADRIRMWSWAGGLVLLALVRFLLANGDASENWQLSVNAPADLYHSALAGMPLVALLFTWSAASAIFLLRRDSPLDNRAFAQSLQFYEAENEELADLGRGALGLSVFLRFHGYTGILVAGGILIAWASNSHSWSGEVDFNIWALVSSLPFALFAAAQGFQEEVGSPDTPPRGLSAYRLGAILLSGGVFLVVLCTQSFVFNNLTSDLRHDISANTSGCIPIRAVSEFDNTPFTHWSISSFALLQQSRAPRTLVLDAGSCNAARTFGPIQLISWDAGNAGAKWFNLAPARARLAVPTASPTRSVTVSPPSLPRTTATKSAPAPTTSATPSVTSSPKPSPTTSLTRTMTASATRTALGSPTGTPTASPTPTLTASPTASGSSKLGPAPSWLPSAHLTGSCTFRLTQGWYAPEQVISGSWQWSSGDGYIRVTAARAMPVVLQVGLVAAMPQDSVNVVLNGKRVAKVAISSAAGPTPISPVILQLRAGGNLLILRSADAAVVLPNDNRAMAMAAVDFTLSVAPNGPVCASPEYDLPPVAITALRSLPNTACTYVMSYGWYDVERNKHAWWRWMSGLGVVRVSATHPLTVMLTGYIASATPPDTVDVLSGGSVVTTIPVTVGTGREAFDPIMLHLQSGINTITFHSHNAPGHIKGDSRNLAIALYDLQIASNSNVPVCALRSLP
jgi:hypothetical protein